MPRHLQSSRWRLAAALPHTISLPLPCFAQSDTGVHIDNASVLPQSPGAYKPITAKERGIWFVRSTVGIQSLTGGLFSAGLGTAAKSPHRIRPALGRIRRSGYGMRLTGISTGNAMEASSGRDLGEDPRYFRAAGQPFGSRVKNIVSLTFKAYRTDGNRHLAYARYGADLGNNFLSNTWRVSQRERLATCPFCAPPMA